MQPDEVAVFESYDSRDEDGTAICEFSQIKFGNHQISWIQPAPIVP